MPTSPIDRIFTPDVIAELRRTGTPHAVDRADVLEAPAVLPDVGPGKLSWLRARRRAWGEYLQVADRVGLIDKDLESRLRGMGASGFRGAMAEAMAAHFFRVRLGRDVQARVPGRRGKIVDLGVRTDDGVIGIEVKSPFSEVPTGAWVGDDADLIAAALHEADGQFADSTANVLVAAPMFKTPIYVDRDQLTRALLGRDVLRWEVDASSHRSASQARVGFEADGRLVREDNGHGRRVRPQGGPKYGRVAAVLSIEEVPENSEGRTERIQHRAFVLYNPFARRPIDRAWFPDVTSLDVRPGSNVVWSDGRAAML